MMTRTNTVPALRFVSFEEDWRPKKIGKITSKVGSGKTPRGGSKIYTDEGVPFIRSQNVNNNRLDLSDLTFIPNEIDEEMANSRVHPNDILLNITGASIGRSCVVPSDFQSGNVNQHVCIIRLDPNYDARFLQPLLASSRGQKLIETGQTGSGREGLNFQSIRSFSVGFPTLSEQRKIADFLTAVDGRIGQLIQKKALLEDYKKGVMQQLFSQAIRFKDEHGNDFPDWEEKKLGEVLTIGSGRDYKHLGEGDVPVYGSGGVMTYVDEALYEGESVGIGRKGTIDNPQFLQGAFWTVDTLFYTHSFKKVLPRFIFAVFQTINWKAHNEAGGVPSLSKRTIDKIPLTVPTLPEQTKIADFLSAIDRKIESVATQITETQTFKRGLLQQMFV